MSLAASPLMGKLIKSNGRTAQQDFEALVLLALGQWRERRKAQAFPLRDVRNERLSAAAFLDEALSNARISEERIAQIEQRLAATALGEREFIELFLAAVVKACTTLTWEHGPAMRPPSSNFAWLLGIGEQAESAWTRTCVELSGLHISAHEAIAVAVARAVKATPENFGALSKWPDESEGIKFTQLLASLAVAALRAGSTAYELVDEVRELYELRWRWKNIDSPVQLRTQAGHQLASAEAFLAWVDSHAA